MWVWIKRCFWIILGHFEPLSGYLRAHPNQISPINTEVELVRSILTTPATFLLIFSICGGYHVDVVKNVIFDHFGPFLTIFWVPEQSTESNMAI